MVAYLSEVNLVTSISIRLTTVGIGVGRVSSHRAGSNEDRVDVAVAMDGISRLGGMVTHLGGMSNMLSIREWSRSGLC